MSEHEVSRHDLQFSHQKAYENSPEFRKNTSQRLNLHGAPTRPFSGDSPEATISEIENVEKKSKEESAEAQTVKEIEDEKPEEKTSAAEQVESQFESVKGSESEIETEGSQSEESEQTETQTETQTVNQTENVQSEGDEKAEEPKKSFLDEHKEKHPKEEGEDDGAYACRLYVLIEDSRNELITLVNTFKGKQASEQARAMIDVNRKDIFAMREALNELERDIEKSIPVDDYGDPECTVGERLKEARNVSEHESLTVETGDPEESQEEKEAESAEEKVEEEASEEVSEDKAEPEKPEEPQELQSQQDSDGSETKDEPVEDEQSKPKVMKLPNEQQRKPEKPIDIEIGNIAFDNSHFSWKNLPQADKAYTSIRVPKAVVDAVGKKLEVDYPHLDRFPKVASVVTGAILAYLRDGDKVITGVNDEREEFRIGEIPVDHNTKTIFFIFSGLSGYSAVLDNQLAADKKLDKLAADFRRVSGRDVLNEQVLRTVELMLGWLIADRFGFPDEEGESLDRMQAAGQGYERMSFEVKSIETVLNAVEETMKKQWEQSKEAKGREIHKDRGKANDAITGKNPEGGVE